MMTNNSKKKKKRNIQKYDQKLQSNDYYDSVILFKRHSIIISDYVLLPSNVTNFIRYIS